MKSEDTYFISPEQLCIGLYVHLDLGWMDHPFTFNNFKIKDEAQLAEIRKLRLKQVRYDPFRSDCEPLTPGAEPAPPTPSDAPPQPAAPARMEFRELRLQALHAAIRDCEKKYDQASLTVRSVEREIHRAPAKSLEETYALINEMVDSVMTEGEIVLHSMQPRTNAPDAPTHALNVTVLSLVLAKSMDMSEEATRHLALGALLHDIGKMEIPDRVLKKDSSLSRAELALVQQHPMIGGRFGADIGLPPSVTRIIQQHHEFLDGSGYPNHLRQEQIDALTRIVSVTNLYDNLCNSNLIGQMLTPYEALSHMFAHLRAKCDPNVLKLLIKSLGVYPPGSIVRLSSEVIGVVVSINPTKPLRPFVKVHQPEIDRAMPLLIDLGEEPGLSITQCLRRVQLPQDALDYLNPAASINYFFDREKPLQQPAA